MAKQVRADQVTVDEALTALAQSLRAGLPPSRNEWTQGLPAAVARQVRRGVEAGRPLAEILPPVFSFAPHEAVLLAAGEAAGTLPETLDAVVAGRKQHKKTRRRIMLALAYPMLVLLAAIVFLPLPLLFTDSAQLYFRIEGLALTFVLGPLFVAFIVWPRLPPSALRDLPWTTLRSMPIIGRRLAFGPTATLADVLGRSLAAGLPVTASLKSSLTATGDRLFAQSAADAVAVIEGGGTLAEALLEVEDLPPTIVRQVAVAETAGRLEEVLRVLHDDARDRYQRTIWALIIFVGAVVFAFAALVAVIGIATAAQTFYFDRLDSILDAAER